MENAIKINDKYWSLIQVKSKSFGIIIWVMPNQTEWQIGDEIYLSWAGGEQLRNTENLLTQFEIKMLPEANKTELLNYLNSQP